MRIDRGEGHVRVGRAILARTRQSEGSPLIDGGYTNLVHSDPPAADRVERFGAIVLRRPRGVGALSIGWLDARGPNPGRWRWRFLKARVLWHLRGRPLHGVNGPEAQGCGQERRPA